MENNDASNASAPSELMAEFSAETGMVESAFVAALRAKLGAPGDELVPWPSKKLRQDRAKCLSQMAKVFRSLFLKLERRDAIPRGAKGSALAVLNELLAGSKWPNFNDPVYPVPPAYADNDHFKTFRRYEIGCAAQLLYEAYNRRGGGGGKNNYPPKIP